MMLKHTIHRFALTVFSCTGILLTESVRSEEQPIADELDAIAQVADARMKEGTAGLADLLKIQIATNFAKYKIEEISKDDLRKKNAPLEKKLIALARAAYQQKVMSTNDVLATIDFISNHR